MKKTCSSWLLIVSLCLTSSLFEYGCTGSASHAPSSLLSIPDETSAAAKPDLIHAVAHRDYDQINHLISAGADVNETVGSGQKKLTPLLVAVAVDDPKIARLLKASGATDTVTFDGYFAYDFALIEGDPTLIGILRNYAETAALQTN